MELVVVNSDNVERLEENSVQSATLTGMLASAVEGLETRTGQLEQTVETDAQARSQEIRAVQDCPQPSPELEHTNPNPNVTLTLLLPFRSACRDSKQT